jgi:hypothetical protein
MSDYPVVEGSDYPLVGLSGQRIAKLSGRADLAAARSGRRTADESQQ